MGFAKPQEQAELWFCQSNIPAKAEQPDPLVSISLRSAEEEIISVDVSAPLRDPSLIALFWGFRLSWLGLGTQHLCGQGTLCLSAGAGEEPGTAARVGKHRASQCRVQRAEAAFGGVFCLALILLDF